MLLRIDPDDARPLYQQIAAAVRHALLEGSLRPGDRLPSGRDLADALDVNLDTVQRAYRELVDEGLVVSRAGRGTTVVGSVEQDQLALDHQIDRLLETARRLGVTVPELTALLDQRA